MSQYHSTKIAVTRPKFRQEYIEFTQKEQMLLTDLSTDDLLCVLRFASAPELARCRQTCSTLKMEAESEDLWERHCGEAGLGRNGSSRPTSRTYCSWRQSWMDGRCVECGDTYAFKINLDGGSSSVCTWHGAKVALCRHCACVAVFCYRSNAGNSDFERHLARLHATYSPEGWIIARICGRNLEGLLQGSGVKFDRWLSKWQACGQETARAARAREAAAETGGASRGSSGSASCSTSSGRGSGSASCSSSCGGTSASAAESSDVASKQEECG